MYRYNTEPAGQKLSSLSKKNFKQITFEYIKITLMLTDQNILFPQTQYKKSFYIKKKKPHTEDYPQSQQMQRDAFTILTKLVWGTANGNLRVLIIYNFQDRMWSSNCAVFQCTTNIPSSTSVCHFFFLLKKNWNKLQIGSCTKAF